MNWIAESSEVAAGVLARAISAELARAREALEGRTDLSSSVHEARRAIKRTRALLKLADPRSGDSHTDRTMRDASRALALLRDADVVVVTAEDIRAGSRSSEPNLVPRHLLESLEDERGRRFAESGSAAGPRRRAHALVRSAHFYLPATHPPPVPTKSTPLYGRWGRGARIRPEDLLLPKQPRYQAALRPVLKLPNGEIHQALPGVQWTRSPF